MKRIAETKGKTFVSNIAKHQNASSDKLKAPKIKGLRFVRSLDLFEEVNILQPKICK